MLKSCVYGQQEVVESGERNDGETTNLGFLLRKRVGRLCANWN